MPEVVLTQVRHARYDSKLFPSPPPASRGLCPLMLVRLDVADVDLIEWEFIEEFPQVRYPIAVVGEGSRADLASATL